MRGNTGSRVLALVPFLLLAGCADSTDRNAGPAAVSTQEGAAGTAAAAPITAAANPGDEGMAGMQHGVQGQTVPLDLRLEGCREGGGYTVYGMNTPKLLDVWTYADIQDRLGRQTVGSYGAPITGAAQGNYHATIACDSYTFRGESGSDLVFGFVVVQVEPPAFDTGGATLHFLSAQILTNKPDIAQEIQRQTGLHVMVGAGLVEMVSGSPVVHAVWDGLEMHGVFDANVPVQRVRTLEQDTYRLWSLQWGGDKMFHPVAIDVRTLGGEFYTAPGAIGTLSQTEAGQSRGQPALAANSNAIYIDGFSATIDFGPRPSVMTTAEWEHLKGSPSR